MSILGLKGQRMPECTGGCQLSARRSDTCKPGVCYARLTHPDNWDSDTWTPRPEEDEPNYV